MNDQARCACQRLDEIESQLRRTRALLEQRRQEVEALRSDLQPMILQELKGSREVVPLPILMRTAILYAVNKMPPLEAAKALGIGKTTLYRKLKEYGFRDRVPSEASAGQTGETA